MTTTPTANVSRGHGRIPQHSRDCSGQLSHYRASTSVTPTSRWPTWLHRPWRDVGLCSSSFLSGVGADLLGVSRAIGAIAALTLVLASSCLVECTKHCGQGVR